MRVLVWVLIWGCASVAPELAGEVDLPSEQIDAGSYRAPSGRVASLTGGVLSVDGAAVARDVIGAPAWDDAGERVVFIERTAAGTRVRMARRADAWAPRTLVDGPGSPDRVALSADGRLVAFAWAGPRGGVAGMWVVDAEGGVPRQLTNAAVVRRKDGPPEGFVPLPTSAPWFDGRSLRWLSEDGEHAVEVTP